MAYAEFNKVRSFFVPSNKDEVPEGMFNNTQPKSLSVDKRNPYYFDIDEKMIIRRSDMCLIRATWDVNFIPKIVKKIGPHAFAFGGNEKTNPELTIEGDITFIGFNAFAFSNYTTITFLGKSYPLDDEILYKSKVNLVKNIDMDIFRVRGNAIIPAICGYCYNDIIKTSDPELLDSYIFYMQYYFEDIKKCFKNKAVMEFIKEHADKFNTKFLEKIKSLSEKGYYKNTEIHDFLCKYNRKEIINTINPIKKEISKKYIIINKNGYDTIVRYIGNESIVKLPIPTDAYDFKFNDCIFESKKGFYIKKLIILSEIKDVYFTLCSKNTEIVDLIFEEGVESITEDIFKSVFINLFLPASLKSIYSKETNTLEYSLLCKNNYAHIYFPKGNNRYEALTFDTNECTQYYLVDKSAKTIIYYPKERVNKRSWSTLDEDRIKKISKFKKVLPRDFIKNKKTFI